MYLRKIPLSDLFVMTGCCTFMLKTADGANYLGREFILHFPCVGLTEPMLNIYTLLDQAVRVFITVPLQNENVRKQVTVQKSTVANFGVKKSYLTWQWDFVQKPIVLDAKYLFGVMVELESSTVSDNFLAIPVENYGTEYYIVALEDAPLIVLMSAHNHTSVNITLEHKADETIVMCFNNETMNFNDYLSFLMLSHQALTIWECQGYTVDTMELKSGALITASKPLGVIASSCVLETNDNNTRLCTTKAVEMLLPVESYGTEFVIPNVQKLNSSSENVYVLVLSPETKVKVTAGDVEKNYTLGENAISQRLIKIKVEDDFCILTSDQRVSVYYVIYQRCSGSEELLGVAIAVVIKSDLFYNKYVWSSLSAAVSETESNVIFICKDKDKDSLRLDERKPSLSWQSLRDTGWVAASTKVKAGFHDATSSGKFGAYLHVISGSTIVLYPVGYFADFQVCKSTQHLMLPADDEDNDCDGKIDEEFDNGIDDDKDSKIDEDVYNSTIIETTKECPPLTYGVNCSQHCPNCDPDCDKETGECDQCFPGYTLEKKTCIGCPVGTFGVNCSGNCYAKCQEDCLDRTYGSCSRLAKGGYQEGIASYTSTIMLIVIPTALFCILLVCNNRQVTVPPPAE